MPRLKGSKDLKPRKVKKQNTKKIRMNYFYVSEFHGILIEKAREKGFTVSKILDMALTQCTITKQVGSDEFEHTLKLLKQEIATVSNQEAKPARLKWQTRHTTSQQAGTTQEQEASQE